MVALSLLLAAAASAPLLPYPVKGTRFELDNASNLTCDCLHLSGSSPVRALLNDDERIQLDDLMRRVADAWADSDRHQRARLLADYLHTGNPGRLTFYLDVVLSCRDGMHVRVLNVLMPTGENATLLRDLETGETLLHIHATKGSPAEFVRLLLAAHGPAGGTGRPGDATPDAEARQKVEELKKRFAKELETKLDSWDVNGQIYLPREGAQPGEAFADGEIDCGGVGGPLAAMPALDPDYVLATRPPKLTCRRDASFRMPLSSFELPSNASLESFFGRRGWAPLPPDLSFADALKWLRARR